MQIKLNLGYITSLALGLRFIKNLKGPTILPKIQIIVMILFAIKSSSISGILFRTQRKIYSKIVMEQIKHTKIVNREDFKLAMKRQRYQGNDPFQSRKTSHPTTKVW